MEGEACKYRTEKLKQRPTKYFGTSIVFHKLPDSSQSELVYSSKIQIQDLINHTIELREISVAESLADMQYDGTDDIPKILFYTAVLLRSGIKATVGIEDNPLNPSDISASKASELIPKNLSKFVEWITKSDRQFNATTDFDETYKEASVRQKMSTLSFCQDIVFINSNGEKKTVKTCWTWFYST